MMVDEPLHKEIKPNLFIAKSTLYLLGSHLGVK